MKSRKRPSDGSLATRNGGRQHQNLGRFRRAAVQLSTRSLFCSAERSRRLLATSAASYGEAWTQNHATEKAALRRRTPTEGCSHIHSHAAGGEALPIGCFSHPSSSVLCANTPPPPNRQISAPCSSETRHQQRERSRSRQDQVRACLSLIPTQKKVTSTTVPSTSPH